jgi:predicted nuclease of restriction endonuclease-like RecB superfamily
MTRGEIHAEVDALMGPGGANLFQQGLAKVLEDRAEFEVVADIPPEQLREKVFTAAANARKHLATLPRGPKSRFRADDVLAEVAAQLNLPPARLAATLFADLKDEARLLRFEDLSARKLLDRYNVALAQALLLRAVHVRLEVRGESPARYRHLLRLLKFHRLLYHLHGDSQTGYVFQIDGPLSLFSATTKYGLQIANFLPAVLLCNDFLLDAEIRWGPQRAPRDFHLDPRDGLVSHYTDPAHFVPDELNAFLDRFRTVAPDWELAETSEILELPPDAVLVPDFQLTHRPSKTRVLLDIVGFWNRSALDRLLSLLPRLQNQPYLLAISERYKVDDSEALASDAILRFRELPNAQDLRARLEQFLPRSRPLLH